MNEFKFACPNCQQNIQATPEYSGAQINCPVCQKPLTVPMAPGMSAPPASKLTKAPSTVQHAATSPAMINTFLVAHKKPRIGLYVGLGVGAAVIAAGIFFGPPLYDKISQQHQAKVAAEIAATNTPPPPPPELTGPEILKKTGAVYKSLASYKAQGESTATIDMSEISPSKKPQSFTSSSSIVLARSGNYKMEWERKAGSQTSKGAVWSAGQGDFVKNGASTTKMKDRSTAMGYVAGVSGSLVIFTTDLFFDDPGSIAVALKNPSRTNDETLDGSKCYVVAGQIASQNMVFWINRTNFLLAQAEIILGGKIDEALLDKLTAAQKAQAMAASKIKGSFVENYSNVEVNKTPGADAFQGDSSTTAPNRMRPGAGGLRPSRRERPQ